MITLNYLPCINICLKLYNELFPELDLNVNLKRNLNFPDFFKQLIRPFKYSLRFEAVTVPFWSHYKINRLYCANLVNGIVTFKNLPFCGISVTVRTYFIHVTDLYLTDDVL